MDLRYIAVILVLNYGISWWNAYATGKCWVEAKAIGGWIRLVAWSGAIMAGLGFSTVYLFLIAYAAYWFGRIDEATMQLALSLGYVGMIVPLLATGLIITMESWRRAYRDRSLVNMGVAAWNTYATVHNTMSAFDGLGSALQVIGKAYGSVLSGGGSAKGKVGAAALLTAALIVLVATLAGALQAAVLIQKYAATEPMPAAIAAHAAAIPQWSAATRQPSDRT